MIVTLKSGTRGFTVSGLEAVILHVRIIAYFINTCNVKSYRYDIIFKI